jgi:hypothetical protein
VPRNHLDLRHRLDERGKRYGKVIEYRLSELRAVELLDGLCEEVGEAHALVDVSGAAATGGGGGGDVSADGSSDTGKEESGRSSSSETTTTTSRGSETTTTNTSSSSNSFAPFRAWLRTRGDGASARLDALGAARPPREVERHQQSELTTFCGALMDAAEDAVVEALRGDAFGGDGGVAGPLCEQIAGRCGGGEVEQQAARLDEAGGGGGGQAADDGGDQGDSGAPAPTKEEL